MSYSVNTQDGHTVCIRWTCADIAELFEQSDESELIPDDEWRRELREHHGAAGAPDDGEQYRQLAPTLTPATRQRIAADYITRLITQTPADASEILNPNGGVKNLVVMAQIEDAAEADELSGYLAAICKRICNNVMTPVNAAGYSALHVYNDNGDGWRIVKQMPHPRTTYKQDLLIAEIQRLGGDPEKCRVTTTVKPGVTIMSI